MMDIWKVRMAVIEGIVLVSVRVRLGTVPSKIVLMAMMLVVRVGVNVRQRLVLVQVPVALGEMQRHAGRHQDRRDPERRVRRLAEQRERRRGTDKGRGRKISCGSRGAELPQCHYEKSKAYAIAEQPDQGGRGGGLRCRQPRPKGRRHAKVDGSSRQTFDAGD